MARPVNGVPRKCKMCASVARCGHLLCSKCDPSFGDTQTNPHGQQSDANNQETNSVQNETTFTYSAHDVMEKYRQAFERARSFEDDDEFFLGPIEEQLAFAAIPSKQPKMNAGATSFTPLKA
ncbi:hypothetical protein DOTSEDRAFT_22781 [Dothistroma septosporum NZE10]|uniref:Uncharacterized protein n=1 Tax=Dothistroma septosporum (strain NZE10 / CBS 128990) TaxID=675120 RepID=N1PUX5_DOTSN|nr:hypothetical protein DOTSEDRAFT_22781 [Dothistroma septosporum NZE10]